MNLCMGNMTAAEAIGIANKGYSQAKAAGDTAFNAAAAADAGGSFDWSTFLANIVRPQVQNAPAAVASKPSTTPYLIAGGAALLAILVLK